MNCYFLNGSASRAESPVVGYVITSDVFGSISLMLACALVLGIINGTFSRNVLIGFGIKFPNGIKGAKAKPVPAAPISFRKSRLDKLDFFEFNSDIFLDQMLDN